MASKIVDAMAWGIRQYFLWNPRPTKHRHKPRLHMAQFNRARPGTEPGSVPGPDMRLFRLSGPGTAPTRSSIWPPSICVMSCVCWLLFFNFDDVTELVCNNYENSNLKKLFDVALFVNSRRHNSADQLSPHCVVIIAFLYYKSVWRSKIAMA